ncbi:hypothetical protein C4577_06385 [Candidatus Parcubacteria bacterium]|nr:MAG: hypothetical protein C4577_06385 [Candidatus Parcubacteria bacterium]
MGHEYSLLNKLPNCQFVYGYHGTSIEVLTNLVKTGKLLGWTTDSFRDRGLPQKGDFYFVINYKRFPNIRRKKLRVEDPVDFAKAYAEMITRRHFLATNLKLTLEESRNHLPVLNHIRNKIEGLNIVSPEESSFLDKEFDNLCKKVGLSESDVEKILKELKRRKGFVLALGDSLKDDFKIKLADEKSIYSEERRIELKGGLNSKYIVGIEPQGEAEKELLSSLVIT